MHVCDFSNFQYLYILVLVTGEQNKMKSFFDCELNRFALDLLYLIDLPYATDKQSIFLSIFINRFFSIRSLYLRYNIIGFIFC